MSESRCASLVQLLPGIYRSRGERYRSATSQRRAGNARFLRLGCLVFLCLVALPVRAGNPAFAIAASEPVELSELNRADLQAIFLGRRRQWSDGTRIKIALPASQEEQREFLEQVVDRSPRQFWAHWRSIVFAGRGTMPKTFPAQSLLVDYLEEQGSAIGLISALPEESRQPIQTTTLDGMN